MKLRLLVLLGSLALGTQACVAAPSAVKPGVSTASSTEDVLNVASKDDAAALKKKKKLAAEAKAKEKAKLAADAKAAKEKKLAAKAKADEKKKQLAEAKAKADEKAKIAAKAKAEREKQLAAKRKADEVKKIARAKAAEERKIAQAQAAAERKAAREKAAEERKIARAKAAEERRLLLEAKAKAKEEQRLAQVARRRGASPAGRRRRRGSTPGRDRAACLHGSRADRQQWRTAQRGPGSAEADRPVRHAVRRRAGAEAVDAARDAGARRGARTEDQEEVRRHARNSCRRRCSSPAIRAARSSSIRLRITSISSRARTVPAATRSRSARTGCSTRARSRSATSRNGRAGFRPRRCRHASRQNTASMPTACRVAAEPARRTRHLSLRQWQGHASAHPRHDRTGVDRHRLVERLLPHDQRARHGSLPARSGRHPGRRPLGPIFFQTRNRRRSLPAPVLCFGSLFERLVEIRQPELFLLVESIQRR